MRESLLVTKLYTPARRENGVDRPRLTAKLSAGARRPGCVTLVSGPAGFGKTTLIADVIRQSKMDTAWLSLDEGDNDPIRFWTYFIKACQTALSSFGDSALALLNMPQVPAGDAVPLMLVNELAGIDSELFLVLDDLHVIENKEIHQSLAWLVDHLPTNFHLIASTRVDPPWPLARMRARNKVVEIRVNELRFTNDEAAVFLKQLVGIELPIEDIEALEARTEGWAAGLQLAALSMQGREDISGFIKSFSGSHLYIAEYLVEEVFKKQTKDVQAFLLRTSILNQMNSGLCEAVTGYTNGQEYLMALLHSNLFVLALDDEGNWFRYHHLFADLLQNRLRQSESPEVINDLHERAAIWFEQAGMDGEAIEHATAAGNFPHVIKIVERVALPMIIQAHVRTVEGWLKTIPGVYLEKSLKINLACAWMYLVRSLPELAEPYLERLRVNFSQVEAGKGDEAARGEWLGLQAKLLNLEGKTEECIELANRALKLIPSDLNDLRTLIKLELAIAYQKLPDFDLAGQTFQMVAQDARASGDYNGELLATSGRARMLLMQGKLSSTLQAAEEGLRRMEAAGKFTPFSATLYGMIGQVYYHRHKLDLAEEFLLRSVQISGRSGYVDPEMHYHIIQSKIRQMEGNWNGAENEMEKVGELMHISPPAMVRESVAAQQIRVALERGMVKNAQTILKGEGISFEDEGQCDLLSTEPTFPQPVGFVYNSLIRYCFYALRTKGSSLDLSKLAKFAKAIFNEQVRWQQIPEAIETALLRFQIFAALGDEPHSLSNLAKAVKLAEAEGFINVFLEEGPEIEKGLVNLLKQNLLETADPAFIHEILAAFTGAKSGETRLPQTKPDKIDAGDSVAMPIEALTKRELEVLRLIAAGDSNKTIAQKLVITISAVKKHTANLYGKLGVNSRTQAVARAREVRLLAPGE